MFIRYDFPFTFPLSHTPQHLVNKKKDAEKATKYAETLKVSLKLRYLSQAEEVAQSEAALLKEIEKEEQARRVQMPYAYLDPVRAIPCAE